MTFDFPNGQKKPAKASGSASSASKPPQLKPSQPKPPQPKPPARNSGDPLPFRLIIIVSTFSNSYHSVVLSHVEIDALDPEPEPTPPAANPEPTPPAATKSTPTSKPSALKPPQPAIRKPGGPPPPAGKPSQPKPPVQTPGNILAQRSL